MKQVAVAVLLMGIAAAPSVSGTNLTSITAVGPEQTANLASFQTVQISESQLLSIRFDTLQSFQTTLNNILESTVPQNVYPEVAADLKLDSVIAMSQSSPPIVAARTKTSEEWYDTYLSASKALEFDAISFKREMLLSIGNSYDLQIAFSAYASEPTMVSNTASEAIVGRVGTRSVVGGLAGVGLLSLASGSGSKTPVDTTFLGESSAFIYDASRAKTFTESQEYKNVDLYQTRGVSEAERIHPYSLIGVDYAFGMGLSGKGKVVAINDIEWNDDNNPLADLVEFKGRTISKFGKLEVGNSKSFPSLVDIENGNLENPVNFHGDHVTGIAAAGFDNVNVTESSVYTNAAAGGLKSTTFKTLSTLFGGDEKLALLNHGTVGLAYEADLFITDFNNGSRGTGSLENSIQGNTQNFVEAKKAGAIVINNSWCLTLCDKIDNDLTLADIRNYRSDNPGATVAETFAALDTKGDAKDWEEWFEAMDSFQETGVIVFITGNDKEASSPKALGGLPEFVPELAEAWLIVGNLQVNGEKVTSETVAQQGNQCGAAAEYCVHADGTDIISTVGGFDRDGDGTIFGDAFYHVETGTSMAAPQVSGAIALLSQAFPNHTPDQLVDRILASATNDFFVADDYTTFINGVTHGYNAKYGHGIVNLEAALQPIGSASMIPANGETARIYRASRFSLGQSSVDLGYSFGDSLSQALNGQTAFFYDGLNGGFAFDAATLINRPKKTSSILVAPASLTIAGNDSLQFAFESDNQLGRRSYNSPALSVTRSISDVSSISVGEKINPQIWALGLSELANGSKIEQASEFAIPFLQASESGRYAGIETAFAGQRIAITSFSGTSPVNSVSSRGLLMATTTTIGESKIASFLGTTFEDAGLLDSSINGAFAESSDAVTQFAGVAARGQLSSNWGYETMASLGFSRLDVEGSGMLKDIDHVTSSAFAFEAIRSLDHATSLHIGLSQPLRVESGQGEIELPLLYDADGVISSHTVQADLSPSGRQIDFKTGMRRDLGGAGVLKMLGVLSKDAGHIRQTGLTPSALVTWAVKF